MIKDHSDTERGNPLLPHGLLFSISSKGSFIAQWFTMKIDSTTHCTIILKKRHYTATYYSKVGKSGIQKAGLHRDISSEIHDSGKRAIFRCTIETCQCLHGE